MDRAYQPLLGELLHYFPVVAVIGARQVGKSTLVQKSLPDAPVFDLERQADFEAISQDPDLFFRTQKTPIILDEAQLLPELFSALRVGVDEKRDQNGRYIITGSSSPSLVRSLSESLAGRIGILELAPLSLNEIHQKEGGLIDLMIGQSIDAKSVQTLEPVCSLADVYEYWFYGGYPEPWFSQKERFRELWFEQYRQTYINRDLANLFPRLNQTRFQKFLGMLAHLSGQVLNLSEIARSLDVSQPTVKDYLDIAHGMFLWRQIPAFCSNVKKRVVKHPKGYFRDSGILHHLLQLGNQRQLLSHPKIGSSWEGVVTEELIRRFNQRGERVHSFHYRTSAGGEVDLVLKGKFGLVPIEIKHTQKVSRRQLKSLESFIEEQKCPYGLCINNDERPRVYSEKIFGIPLHFV